MNIQQAMLFGKKQLKQCGIESYAIDTTLLLMKATFFSKVQLYTQNNFELTAKQQKQFLYDLEQRKQQKPIQYITGECEFMGLHFAVQEGVLIPRPDTEILVETVLKHAQSIKKAIDICTGTGCIAISLSKYSTMSLCGVDISTVALQTAQKNAQNIGVAVEWFQSDLLESVPQIWKTELDAIVSNPPYIASDEIPFLSNTVKDFEPHLALDGGKNGCDFYHKITKQARHCLRKGGWIFFEIGYQQAKNVTEILIENGFENIAVYQDLAGLDRVVSAQKKC